MGTLTGNMTFTADNVAEYNEAMSIYQIRNDILDLSGDINNLVITFNYSYTNGN